MLQRIRTLNSLGKFHSFAWDNDSLPILKKHTVIFAPNAYGKSTFVAVLRSLAEPNPGLLIGRRTLSKNSDPLVVLEWEGGLKSVFEGRVWEKGLPNGLRIELFDPEYVRRNLFTDEITTDHKREICRIILGEKGQEIKQRLDTFQERTKELKKRKKERDAEKERRDQSVGGEDYLGIANKHPKEKVETRANDLKARHLAKQQEEALRKMPLPEPLSLKQPDFEQWRIILSESAQSLHESTRKRVEEHLRTHFGDVSAGKSFAYQGLQRVDKTCPFCGQDINAAGELMEAYRAYFDKSYAESKERLDQLHAEIEKWQLEAVLTALRRAESLSLERIAGWRQHIELLPVPQSLLGDWDSHCLTMQDAFLSVKRAVDGKRHSPDKKADLSGLQQLSSYFKQMQSAILAFNETVDRARKEVYTFMESLLRETMEELAGKMGIAKAFVKRYTPEEEKWCRDYEKLARETREAEEEEKNVTRELKEYSEEEFRAHQERTNRILEELGADFRLASMKPKTAGNIKSAVADFGIVIEGIETSPFGSKAESPNFKNTLSEGDRNSLAFAFFLSTLENRADLAQTVLVFDDPISSLDRHRRRGVIRALKELSGNVKQILILTHNEDFLRCLPDSSFFPDACYLEVLSDKASGSRFVPLDPKGLLKSEHRKMVEELRKYLTSNEQQSTEDMRGKVRKVLEDALEFKYFECLNGVNELGGMLTVLEKGGKIQHCIDELNKLNQDSRTSHHGGTSHQVFRDSGYDEICPLIRDTLNVLERI